MIEWGPWHVLRDVKPNLGEYIQCTGIGVETGRVICDEAFVVEIDGKYVYTAPLPPEKMVNCHWRRARLPDEDKKVIREREMEDG